MKAIVAGVLEPRPFPGRHWAARPIPEPPRSRRVSKWTHVPPDKLQDELEGWLREHSVSYTYDGE